MGTLLMYMIVIALLVMVYLLWEIRTAITDMSGQLGVLVRIQRSLAPGVAGDGWPNNED